MGIYVDINLQVYELYVSEIFACENSRISEVRYIGTKEPLIVMKSDKREIGAYNSAVTET